MMQHNVYIGLGSNLDNPLIQVKSAIKEISLNKEIILEAVSGIYQSKALTTQQDEDYPQQADYINAVVRVKTNYIPEVLLKVLQSIEQQHNRVKKYRWGPRSLDLDILLYDDLQLKTKTLTIPHVEIANRNFVLYPLNDIEPALKIPKYGKLSDILITINKQDLRLLEASPEII